MTRQRPNAPAVTRPRRSRSGAPSDNRSDRRVRRRNGVSQPDLTDEELWALADENVDPDELLRVAREAQDDEQEASDHDRDTTRDRLEGLLLDQDEQF